jgi:U3 small nucleolar RNA-associated protein MPP10
MVRLKDKRSKNKRKRDADAVHGGDEVLKIRRLHVEGLETGQVWQQARRVIACALRESADVLQELEEDGKIETEAEKRNGRLDNSDQEIPDEEEEEDEDEDDDEGEEDDDEDDLGEGIEEELDDEDGIQEDGSDLDEELGFEDEDDDEDFGQPSEEYVADPNGLNDGFFSIDDFNKQTQWFEEQDARADPNTDQVSDDEDLDWHTDPFSQKPRPKSQSKSAKKNNREDAILSDNEAEEEEDDDDEEGGPTFGNMDLYAPEGESGDELGDGLDNDLDLNANDIFYKDFFAPPAKKAKNGGPKPRKAKRSEPDEADMERAMNDVRRDLFDDLSEHSGSDDDLSDVSAGDPKSRRSAHERRQAKLAEEIRKLEAASVAKRAWTLSGEAAAVDRPMNSLLEEDVNFEHAGKPAPVITEEVSESIEALIKRRILAQEFDEVLRRRPDALNDKSATRRGLVELDDTKGKQSLAEIYEEAHIKTANPDTYVSKADEKLRAEEQEVERLWRDISGKLDALSSWHFRPKPAEPIISIVADAATITMEDAQPATAQGVAGGDSMVAPQEVYRAGGDTAERGEVVAKSGLPLARQEMSREEKQRIRRREKERRRKSGEPKTGKDGKLLSQKAQQQKETIGELKKAGVKVINRKGEIVDMDGNRASGGAKLPATSARFKL